MAKTPQGPTMVYGIQMAGKGKGGKMPKHPKGKKGCG